MRLSPSQNWVLATDANENAYGHWELVCYYYHKRMAYAMLESMLYKRVGSVPTERQNKRTLDIQKLIIIMAAITIILNNLFT